MREVEFQDFFDSSRTPTWVIFATFNNLQFCFFINLD